MTVMLIAALRAAETLAEFHLELAENADGAALAYHIDMAKYCVEDAERITQAIAASGPTAENQAAAMRRRDLDTAHKIIQRHTIYARRRHAG